MRALLVLGSLVAQSVERRTVNPLVVGSSPTQGAIYFRSVPDTSVTFYTESYYLVAESYPLLEIFRVNQEVYFSVSSLFLLLLFPTF